MKLFGHHRFDYEISEPKQCCKWGNPVANGTNFTGLVGDLFNGYSDVGWANLFFNSQRTQLIDFTDPYRQDHGGFMVKLWKSRGNNLTTKFLFKVGKPKPIPLWMNVFQPFARPVWISVLALLPIRFVFLLILGKMYPSKYLQKRSIIQLLVALPLKQTSKRDACFIVE